MKTPKLDRLILTTYANTIKNRRLLESYERLQEAIDWEAEHPLPGGKVTPSAKNAWITIFSNPSFQYMRNMGLHVVKNVGDTDVSSQHSTGNAIDIGGTKSEMQELADWLVSNANSLSVNNVIYNERIWNPGQGWHVYNWRRIGSTPHTDHVHVDFFPVDGRGGGGSKKDDRSNTETKSSDVLTIVTSYSVVGRWILSHGGSIIMINGKKNYIYYDVVLGRVLIKDGGKAYVFKNKTETTWKFFKKTNGTYELQIGNKASKPKYEPEDTSLRAFKKDSDIAVSASLEQLHTALDWLGWIPGFGDILDAVNAAIYFAEGRIFYGFLSLVAIVPMVGSAAAKGVKAALKSFPSDLSVLLKQAAKSGDPTDLAKFWKHAIETGQLDAVTIRKLGAYGDELAELLVSGKNKILQHEDELRAFGIDSKAVGRQIDEVLKVFQNCYTKPLKEAWYTKFGKQLGSLAKDVGVAVAKLPINLAKQIFNVTASFVTLGSYNIAKNILKKLSPGNVENAAKLVKALDVTFKQKLMDSPTILTALVRQESKDYPQIAKYLQQASGVSGIKNIKQLRKQRAKFRASSGSVSGTTANLYKTLSDLKQTNPKEYASLVNDVHSVVSKSGNPYYRAYMSDSALAAMNIFKPGTMFKANIDSSLKNLAKNFSVSNPKAWDVIANEIEDSAERLGIDPHDDPQGVIVASVATMVNYLSSDRYASKSKESEKEQMNPGTLAKMKKIYNETPGSTIDKLKALADAGFSEFLIYLFTRQMSAGDTESTPPISASGVEIVTGEYTVPAGTPNMADALHSFESRQSDGYGGRMLTKITEKLLEMYDKGINPDVTNIQIDVDSATYTVKWSATVQPSTDGKAYVGLSSVGSAGADADTRAFRQLPGMKSRAKAKGADTIKKVLDFRNPSGIYIRQFFYKWTNPTKYPAH